MDLQCNICGADDLDGFDFMYCIFCDCQLCIDCENGTDFGHACGLCYAKVIIGLIDVHGVDRSACPYKRRSLCRDRLKREASCLSGAR